MCKHYYRLIITFLIVCAGVSAADWKDALKGNVESTYSMSKIGLDRIRVTQPGTVFVIKSDGIAGDLATDATFTQNIVENGQVHAPGGAVAFLQNKKTDHIFKAGDKVYLWKTSVGNDNLALFFVSYDTYAVNERGGRSNQMRYKILLDFKFVKDYLPTAAWPAIKQNIQHIVTPEDEIKDAAPKSVSLGQSIADVEAAFGKPEKVLNLGAKTTYIYKHVRVVFTDGKVSDMQ